MDDYDDDDLDRSDFLQITKKDSRTDKTIMTETLRVLDAASSAQSKTSSMKGDLRRQIIVGVEVARQAVQQPAANSVRAQEPAEVMSGRCPQFEREVEALRKQMEVIQTDRDNLHEVKALRKELFGYKAPGRGECEKSARSSRASPLGRGAPRTTEDIPLARRPPLRGVEFPRSRGFIRPEERELWVTAVGIKRRKKKKRGRTNNNNDGVPMRASDVISDNASGARTVQKSLTFAMAVRKTRDKVANSGKDARD
ncbi:hypothetical protein G5I_02437 [Acromyrmex echinatior]|uniref:Uncharacterized protein n=1 Tax=Acromyrmex echinatior TaxID=103372 RepID=F4WAA7_ACREC|nr:hypothetical protein G5I_02437 [Acromyrmex echinatior]